MSDHTAIVAIYHTHTEVTMPHTLFRIAPIRGFLLGVLLAGCQSTQDVYLAQATDHATAVELEQALGHPNYEQALDTGQRRWLYHQDGGGTGGRDFTPFCQDLWLTFDHNGVLRTWEKQRC
jgi:hypothetical protein